MKNLAFHGHGHVVPRLDGLVARCGGPAICGICAGEKAQHEAEKKAFAELVAKDICDGCAKRDAEIERLRAEVHALGRAAEGYMEAYEKAKTDNARLREALECVPTFDRTRGYPTGAEWTALVEAIRAALEGK